MARRTYSKKFRESMVKRMLPPNPISARALSGEVGVSQTALSRWLKESKTSQSYTTTGKSMSQSPHQKSPQEKLRIVLEASSLSEQELGSFLRKEGIHHTHLQQWKQEMLSGLQTKPTHQNHKELRGLKKENQQLQKELSRSKAALAETAALLVLQKKVQDLWGDGDENI